jgi:hypothetical protein
MSMILEAFEWIKMMAGPERMTVVTADGNEREFVRVGYEEIKPSVIEPIKLGGLDNMVAFCEMSETARQGAFLVVHSDTKVELIGAAHPVTRKREVWATCQAPKPHSVTGLSSDRYDETEWMDPEDMIPAILTAFADSEHRAMLLKILGNVTMGATATLTDDGVTQQVATKRGLSLKGTSELPSPIMLQPLATYAEVRSTEQAYIFRAQGGSDTRPPTFRLFTVYDPTYKQRRMADIIDYLTGSVSVPVI